MKRKILLLLAIPMLFSSCAETQLTDNYIIVNSVAQQESGKGYVVTVKAAIASNKPYLLSDYKYQPGDTLGNINSANLQWQNIALVKDARIEKLLRDSAKFAEAISMLKSENDVYIKIIKRRLETQN